MDIKLNAPEKDIWAKLFIPGSKSESNRLLILQALYPEIEVRNLSDCDDTQVLQRGLAARSAQIDIHHAGTAMRFLTAFFSTQSGSKVLTGSDRMQNRPIKILVEALNKMGAQISYEDKKGFPPIKIKGNPNLTSFTSLNAGVSSQYISALLLIAPKLQEGLTLKLEGKILSRPYIAMTLALLNKIGIPTSFQKDTILVNHCKRISPQALTVESDWSSASYFYSIAALAHTAEIRLSTYRQESLQGDARVTEFYEKLGVQTSHKAGNILLKKRTDFTKPEIFKAHLINQPDLTQTLAVTCLGMKIPCHLTGLDNLSIKETDRLGALKAEMSKLGAQVKITKTTLEMIPPKALNPKVSIQTYQDHRMAMAFAPMALKIPLEIKNAEVVRKSFPSFWKTLKKCGFQLVKIEP